MANPAAGPSKAAHSAGIPVNCAAGERGAYVFAVGLRTFAQSRRHDKLQAVKLRSCGVKSSLYKEFANVSYHSRAS